MMVRPVDGWAHGARLSRLAGPSEAKAAALQGLLAIGAHTLRAAGQNDVR